MPRFFTLIFTLFLILGSCTVEKRTFNRGYHVSWNKSFRNKTAVESEGQLAKEELKSSKETVEQEELIAVVPEESEVNVVPVANQELNGDLPESFEQPLTEEQILAESPAASPDTVYYYPKFEPFGIASFAAASLSVVSLFTGIGFIIGFFLAIAGIILGAISMARYKHSRELYKANGFGVAGFILSLLVVIFTIIAIAVILAFLFG